LGRVGEAVRVTQYLPAFYDMGIERAQADANSLDELLALPFIVDWQKMPGFKFYCRSPDPHRDGQRRQLIMVQAESGHYVIAIVPESEPWLDALPVWEGAAS